MTQRTFALTILLILASLSRLLSGFAPLPFSGREQRASEPLIDAESLLASGQPLPLTCADRSSLELIPSISDKTASELLERRRDILRASRERSLEESLQLARGIGEKTAPRLARYLTLTGPCEGADHYVPLSPNPRMK